MADPNAKTFSQLVQGQAAAVQQRAAGLVDFSVGSILRAVVEAVAGVCLFLQALILSLLAQTRASTSQGADLDSWVADWGGPFTADGQPVFSRLGAAPAVGDVTFQRFTATGTALVKTGATVQTSDGRQQFVVMVDTSNPAYNAGLGGYQLQPGVFSLTVPVLGITSGSAGNVLAGTVSVITAAMPGIDTVTNALDFVGGVDTESDAALRVRFRSYLQSLREATPTAIQYWVTALRPGIQASVIEGQERNGTPRRGFVYVVVDDGTGTPPQSLIDDAAIAVDQHRAAGIEFAVYPPAIVVTDVSFTVDTTLPAERAAAIIAARQAVTSYLSSLPLGADLSYNRLFQVAYDASGDITNITNLLINGATQDLPVALFELIKPGTVTVS